MYGRCHVSEGATLPLYGKISQSRGGHPSWNNGAMKKANASCPVAAALAKVIIIFRYSLNVITALHGITRKIVFVVEDNVWRN